MLSQEIIQAARGDRPADRVFTNARVVDVFAGESFEADLAVAGGYMVGFGD